MGGKLKRGLWRTKLTGLAEVNFFTEEMLKTHNEKIARAAFEAGFIAGERVGSCEDDFKQYKKQGGEG